MEYTQEGISKQEQHPTKSDTIQSVLCVYDLTLIDEIHQDNVRLPTVERAAQCALRPNTATARDGIGLRCAQAIGDQDAQDLDVQEMIDDVHAPISRGTGRTVDAATREVRICYVEGGFEVISELVEDIGDGVDIGAVIYPWSVAHTPRTCLLTDG